ncbi:DUF3307 domain-containing protein [Ferruginibacter sp.]|nr:DUF3307 domain-containing protein [Ferruginibacter sp.]
MKNELILFSLEQGNLLIRLLLAHIISDFVLQTDKMVENKKWFSSYMLLHILIVFISAFALSGLWKVSIIIATLHWVIDSIKVEIQSRTSIKPNFLFITDQLFHFLIIAAAWFWHFGLFDKAFKTIALPFVNYKLSLILLAYAWVYFPVGYLIKFATQSISHTNATQTVNTTADDKVEHGGKLIGQFERLIILTLVLLNQYDAIGFLITGKSIIRFADHNSNLRSEYVLVGTMMSYALAILTGVFVNYMLSLK